MLYNIVLEGDERLDTRPFTNPNHSLEELFTMRRMAQQLVDTYADPAMCDTLTGGNIICKSDPEASQFRIYYIQSNLLFSLKAITVVGFFGQKRSGADIRPLLEADKKFVREFNNHPGLLSLSINRLPNGDYGNLVLFTDHEAMKNWNFSKLHQELVKEISPAYYKSVRLYNGILPDGLEVPDDMSLIRIKYLDYVTNPPWRAVRNLD